MLYLSTKSTISASVFIVDKSIYESYSFNPAFLAILETVKALSPEIIFTSIPCSLKYPSISLAFFLNGSSKIAIAITSNSGNSGSLIIDFVYAIPKTLFPLFCNSLIASGIFSLLLSNNLSGAPTTIEPSSLKDIELHFLSDENATLSAISKELSPLKYFLKAWNVALLSSIPLTKAVIISLKECGSIFSLYFFISDTLISPLVIVPVLSKQIVSI